MATQIYLVTDAPVDLIGASDVEGVPLSLEIGNRYQARYQALGPQTTLKVLETGSARPVEASDAALLVRRFEDIAIVPATGLGIFVWSEGDGLLVINDVP